MRKCAADVLQDLLHTIEELGAGLRLPQNNVFHPRGRLVRPRSRCMPPGYAGVMNKALSVLADSALEPVLILHGLVPLRRLPVTTPVGVCYIVSSSSSVNGHLNRSCPLVPGTPYVFCKTKSLAINHDESCEAAPICLEMLEARARTGLSLRETADRNRSFRGRSVVYQGK